MNKNTHAELNGIKNLEEFTKTFPVPTNLFKKTTSPKPYYKK
jgi:hypothetical protein